MKIACACQHAGSKNDPGKSFKVYLIDLSIKHEIVYVFQKKKTDYNLA